jgi:hypothetical protein
MIAHDKRKIILKEGTPVILYPPTGAPIESKALIGRASKQFMNSLSLEENRRGYFLPDVNLDNGWIVLNNTTGEYYIAIAVYPEIYNTEILSIASHMFVCNAVIDISGFSEVWDDYGNKEVTPVVKVSGSRCYLQHVSAELRQFDPGLHHDAEYIIYTQQCDVNLLDTIKLKNNSPEINMKIVDINNFSFNGITKLQVRTDSRV